MSEPLASRLVGAVAGLCAVWLVALPGRAAPIELVSQDRGVSASAFVDDGVLSDSDTDSISAPDFAVFDESVQVAASIPGHDATGTATQLSSIGTGLVTASGAASAFLSTDPLLASAHSSSRFELVFDVPSQASFELFGSVTAFLDDDDISFVQIRLQGGPGNQVIGQALANSHVFDDIVFESGFLAPGQYVLSANASMFGPFSAGPTWGGDYSLSLTVVPEPTTGALVAGGLVGIAAWRRRHLRRPAAARS